jgi:hypothetical protein
VSELLPATVSFQLQSPLPEWSNWRKYVGPECLDCEDVFFRLPRDFENVLKFADDFIGRARLGDQNLPDSGHVREGLEAVWIGILMSSAFSYADVNDATIDAAIFHFNALVRGEGLAADTKPAGFPEIIALKYWPMTSKARAEFGSALLLHKYRHRKATELLFRAFDNCGYSSTARFLLNGLYDDFGTLISPVRDYHAARVVLNSPPNRPMIPFWDVEFGLWLLRRGHSVNYLPSMISLGKILIGRTHRDAVPLDPHECVYRRASSKHSY